MVMVIIIKISIYYSSCNLLHCINIHSLLPIFFISTNIIIIIIIICIILITPIFTFVHSYTLISTNVIECSSPVSHLQSHSITHIYTQQLQYSYLFTHVIECSSPLLVVVQSSSVHSKRTEASSVGMTSSLCAIICRFL